LLKSFNVLVFIFKNIFVDCYLFFALKRMLNAMIAFTHPISALANSNWFFRSKLVRECLCLAPI